MSALGLDKIIAVAGAGAMGSGIAQVAAAAGHQVMLFDSVPGAALKGHQRIAAGLEGQVSRGKMTQEAAGALVGRVHVAENLDQFGKASLCIEAIVERMDIKHALFNEMEYRVGPDVILASNTSSLSVTALARGLKHPERVVGMHFFNPAPVMKLVEVISGAATDPAVAQVTAATARNWGKVAVHARSTPGFIVNRVARPFYAEALRLFEEGCADAVTLDALLVEGAGFRMGPFTLMDLIGHDVNFAVTNAVFNAYHQDPRYRPSLIQQEWVEAGWLGRKAGRGVFSYAADAVMPAPQTEPVSVEGALQPFDASLVQHEGVLVARTDGRTAARRAGDSKQPVILYDALTGEGGKRVALTASPDVDAAHWQAVVGKFQQQGLHVSRIRDLPGMVVMRTIAMIINEGFEAALCQVATPEDIDQAMQLGVNYPRGPFFWAQQFGVEQVLAVLDAIHEATGDPRYRASFGLRHAVDLARLQA